MFVVNEMSWSVINLFKIARLIYLEVLIRDRMCMCVKIVCQGSPKKKDSDINRDNMIIIHPLLSK